MEKAQLKAAPEIVEKGINSSFIGKEERSKGTHQGSLSFPPGLAGLQIFELADQILLIEHEGNL